MHNAYQPRGITPERRHRATDQTSAVPTDHRIFSAAKHRQLEIDWPVAADRPTSYSGSRVNP